MTINVWTKIILQEYLYKYPDGLLKSAGLYGRDIVTGDEEFNLPAIMSQGKDDAF